MILTVFIFKFIREFIFQSISDLIKSSKNEDVSLNLKKIYYISNNTL